MCCILDVYILFKVSHCKSIFLVPIKLKNWMFVTLFSELCSYLFLPLVKNRREIIFNPEQRRLYVHKKFGHKKKVLGGSDN